MSAVPGRLRALTSITVTSAVAFLLLAFVAPALASALTITPAKPVVGDTVTVQTSPTECGNNVAPQFTFTFHNPDGTVTSSGPTGSDTYNKTVSQAGAYTVNEDTYCSSNPAGSQYTYDSGSFTVGDGLGGSISVSPDPPVVNQPATLSTAATGGNPGYTFAWDLNNDGSFTD